MLPTSSANVHLYKGTQRPALGIVQGPQEYVMQRPMVSDGMNMAMPVRMVQREQTGERSEETQQYVMVPAYQERSGVSTRFFT